MEIMSIMLKNTTNLSPLYIQYIFPNVIRILNVSKSNSVLQCGQEFLTVLLQKDFSAVASWVDASISKTGLDYVIGFLAKLLQPDEQESGALFVGELITKLILKVSDWGTGMVAGD